jgi:EAL domain-containing protein (putative c-di-GMP-specific phosphodiesterase class I)
MTAKIITDNLGVLLAINDLGTGFSSFASLRHHKVDYLKIDKYFINDMLNDKKTLLLISAMILEKSVGHGYCGASLYGNK